MKRRYLHLLAVVILPASFVITNVYQAKQLIVLRERLTVLLIELKEKKWQHVVAFFVLRAKFREGKKIIGVIIL